MTLSSAEGPHGTPGDRSLLPVGQNQTKPHVTALAVSKQTRRLEVWLEV